MTTKAIINFDGNDYALLFDAMAENDCHGCVEYIAKAIKVGEQPDSLGQPKYMIYWSVLPNWDGENEEYACDWANPYRVEAL